jgi:hypothetical protein
MHHAADARLFRRSKERLRVLDGLIEGDAVI